MEYQEQKFNILKLKGISAKNIEEHLKLYAGYVKNTNLILKKIPEYRGYEKEDTFAPYVVGELSRRFSFEYNGMRNHEIYFSSLSDGAHSIPDDSKLKKQIALDFGSFESWLAYFKAIATTRGVGWAMLYFDRKENRLLTAWVDEQHLGQLQDCTLILALDMWEHSFVFDYQPSGKKQYIEDFFENLNWNKIEENFEQVIK